MQKMHSVLMVHRELVFNLVSVKEIDHVGAKRTPLFGIGNRVGFDEVFAGVGGKYYIIPFTFEIAMQML